jgi:ATP-dependent Clp protease ATP-binding subunit ClpC
VKARFTLYVRQHRTGWYTIQVMTQPEYTAFGPHPGALHDELREALQQDLADDRLRVEDEGARALPGLRPRRVELALRAVQHGRLVEVPMRFLLGIRELRGGEVEVHIPKLEARVKVRGETEALLWAEEIIRGQLHLEPVSRLLALQYEQSERFDALEVSFTEPGRKGRRRNGPRTSERDADDRPLGLLATLGEPQVRGARAGRLSAPRGRQREVGDILRVLSAAPVPAVLLVGPSGVGKTATLAGLAHRIAKGEVPPRFEDAELWTVPGSRWMAGTPFLGDWQARAREVVEAIRDERAILDLGPLPEVLGASAQEQGLSLAGFLEAEVAEGDLPLVAEITPEALADAERAAPGLLRAFQRVELAPLAPPVVRSVLDAEARRLERAHDLGIPGAAIDATLDVITRFRDPSTLPGSGLALLGQMARHREGEAGAAVTEDDALDAFCRESGFPRDLVDPSRRLDPAAVRRFFETRILGQPEACARLAHVVFLLKAGLTAPDTPIGSFLFTGPTGVGKTESALTLAEYLFGDRERLTRLDMSEYGDPAAALRLVDGRRGEGALTQAVLNRPFGIVLLDEIEKADGGVLDLLLQVLGEARLTDGRGRLVSFRHTVVILTSNLGAGERAPVGFENMTDPSARYAKAVERALRPELLNRIDHVVPFRSLSREVLETLADRLVKAALAREGFARRGLAVHPSPDVVAAVAERGFDPKYGARPMKRAVEDLVIAPLAQHLAGRGARAPRALHLGWDGQRLQISSAVPEAPPPGPSEA